jgi:hypothetical protein
MSVARFAFRRVAKQTGDIRQALNVGLLGEVQIPAVRLRFSGKCCFQIFVGLRTFQIGCHFLDSFGISVNLKSVSLENLLWGCSPNRCGNRVISAIYSPGRACTNLAGGTV